MIATRQHKRFVRKKRKQREEKDNDFPQSHKEHRELQATTIGVFCVFRGQCIRFIEKTRIREKVPMPVIII